MKNILICYVFLLMATAVSFGQNTTKNPLITNIDSVPEVKLDFPIAEGPFKPTWESIDQNYGQFPDWFREAKFGIWIHWGPQVSGKSGDWYARNLYNQGSVAYNNHIKNFGHPSEVGYKDVLHQWNIDKWNPSALMKLYKESGAKYVLIMGVHHDNFDLWDSKYQPWNSVNVGPKRDILGEWRKAAINEGMHFGVSFHHEYTWWWWQWAFGSDKTGPKAGIPYDGNLTKEDGKGKWWEGLDPAQLYTIHMPEYPKVEDIAFGHRGIFSLHQEYARKYATQWALRIQDVVEKYDPDFIYTDGNSWQPFSGDMSGSGYKCDAAARMVADYYNRTLKNHRKDNTFAVIKFCPVNRGLVNTSESGIEGGVKTDQVWMAENAVGDWFYAPGFYYDVKAVIWQLLEAVSRDGNYTVCISLMPDGTFDEGSTKLLKDIGKWMKVNGEGIYGSRAWKVSSEGTVSLPGSKLGKEHAETPFTGKDIRFTVGKDGALYAWLMAWPENNRALITSLAGYKGKIIDVKLLGSAEKVKWQMTDDGLEAVFPARKSQDFAIGLKITSEGIAK